MKRFNSLLQRKHNEFDRGRDVQRASNISNSHNVVRATDLQPMDGYDWLQQIKGSQPSHVQGH